MSRLQRLRRMPRVPRVRQGLRVRLGRMLDRLRRRLLPLLGRMLPLLIAGSLDRASMTSRLRS